MALLGLPRIRCGRYASNSIGLGYLSVAVDSELLLVMVGGSLTCSCGRAFAQHNALSNHQRHCQISKNRLAGALSKFKDLLGSRKRRRVDTNDSDNPATTQSELGVSSPLGNLGLRMVSAGA